MRLVSFRAKSPAIGSKVDRAGNAIRNLMILAAGQMDSNFILSTLGQLSTGKIPAHYKAPAKGDSLGSMVGKIKNAYLSDSGIKADVEFGPYAKNMPGMAGDGSNGDVQGYLMDLVDFDPEALALDIACRWDPYEIVRCELTGAS